MEEKKKSKPQANHMLIPKDELLGMNQFDLENVKAKEFSGNSFRYYTTLKTLDYIVGENVKEKFLYASCLDEMNDRDEANAHSDKLNVHALCFCNTDTEGVPMWYMYSGILGKGACIKIGSREMINFLKSIRTVYPVGQDEKVMKNLPLSIGENIDLQFGRVFYKDEKDDLFFHNRWYRLDDKEKESFFRENYFVKKYPWHYESEFRIVLINKTKTSFKRLAIPLPDDLVKKCEIIFGPEGKMKQCSVKNISKSKLNIRMNLLIRNEAEISEIISEAVKDYIKS